MTAGGACGLASMTSDAEMDLGSQHSHFYVTFCHEYGKCVRERTLLNHTGSLCSSAYVLNKGDRFILRPYTVLLLSRVSCLTRSSGIRLVNVA